MNFRVFKDSRYILAAGKETFSAVGQRTIQIKSTVGEETQLLTLEDVWYVPKVSRNLLSVLLKTEIKIANSSQQLPNAGLK